MKKANLRLVRDEIESKPLEGIPDYRSPISQTIRCTCGQRYLIFFGAQFPFDERAFEAAREDAERRGCQFIDARSIPFMNCECSQALDFVAEDSFMVM